MNPDRPALVLFSFLPTQTVYSVRRGDLYRDLSAPETLCLCLSLGLQRIAALTGEPIASQRVAVPRKRTSHARQRHCGPDPPTTYANPFTGPSRENGHTPSSASANQKAPAGDPILTLPLGQHPHAKRRDLDDLSAGSDLESGVADLSSRSSSGGEDRKDPDSDEAACPSA